MLIFLNYIHGIEMRFWYGMAFLFHLATLSDRILLPKRLTSSMPMHPLPILLNHGVPIALNSDDPAIFGYMGLSYDFFQVIASSEVTGLLTLAQIARDSITVGVLTAFVTSCSNSVFSFRPLIIRRKQGLLRYGRSGGTNISIKSYHRIFRARHTATPGSSRQSESNMVGTSTKYCPERLR